MTRPYNERRNKQILVLIDRRKIPPKEAARKMNLTWDNLRKILSRIRSVTKCHNSSVTFDAKIR